MGSDGEMGRSVVLYVACLTLGMKISRFVGQGKLARIGNMWELVGGGRGAKD